MLRLVGAVLMAGSGLVLGLSGAAQLSRQLEDLRELRGALALMEGELALDLPTTPELLERLACRTRGRTAEFFHRCVEGMDGLEETDFARLWEAAADRSGLLVEGEERTQLLRLGQALGRYDLRHLLTCCRQTGEALERGAERTRQTLALRGRSYGTLGLSLGLFLAILLL